MTKLALFRADGSQHLGLGHIMRCLAFAQGLEKIGARSIFVTRDYEPEAAGIVQRYNYIVETIPGSCGFQEDLRLTSGFAEKYGVKLIVTDLCNTDTITNLDRYAEYLQGLRDRGKFLVTIDDLNEIAFPSNIVINPNCGAENMNYELGKSARFLLGPAYFIFRQEFIDTAGVDREIKREARNILVTTGGSDFFGLALKVAGGIAKLGKKTSLNLRIVLGAAFAGARKRELEAILRDFPGTCQLIQVSDNMADLMLWADLAITSGGLTKYETAVTGTPSIIIPQVAHQAKLAEEYAKKGTALNLGLGAGISEEDIAEAVKSLLMDDARRAKMSINGRELVDGRGIERIISEIPGEVWL